MTYSAFTMHARRMKEAMSKPVPKRKTTPKPISESAEYAENDPRQHPFKPLDRDGYYCSTCSKPRKHHRPTKLEITPVDWSALEMRVFNAHAHALREQRHKAETLARESAWEEAIRATIPRCMERPGVSRMGRKCMAIDTETIVHHALRALRESNK